MRSSRSSLLTLTLFLPSLIACGGSHEATTDAGLDSGSAEEDSGIVGMDSGVVEEDAGPVEEDSGMMMGDAGPLCGDHAPGRCADPSLECLGCPGGGPLENYFCTTRCVSDEGCSDPARPICSLSPGPGTGMGLCVPSPSSCLWGSMCASPDTPIATPEGDRPIASLREGDLVFSEDHGALVAVPILRATSREVRNHRVVRLLLEGGQVLRISPGHPTADGRLFGALRAGDLLDYKRILRAERVPYEEARTHDILPASETGSYVAGGVLIGSTLAPR